MKDCCKVGVIVLFPTTKCFKTSFHKGKVRVQLARGQLPFFLSSWVERREIIQADDYVTIFKQAFRQRTTDESGCTSYQYPSSHRALI